MRIAYVRLVSSKGSGEFQRFSSHGFPVEFEGKLEISFSLTSVEQERLARGLDIQPERKRGQLNVNDLPLLFTYHKGRLAIRVILTGLQATLLYNTCDFELISVRVEEDLRQYLARPS